MAKKNKGINKEISDQVDLSESSGRGAKGKVGWGVVPRLSELRMRILWILLSWFSFSLIAWLFKSTIASLLFSPAVEALGNEASLQALAPTEIFFTYLKISLMVGFGASLPVFFWQLCQFLRSITSVGHWLGSLAFAIVSTLLFLGGGAFGQILAFPFIFEFLSSFSSQYVEAVWSVREVFILSLRLILAFGIGFEVPLIVFAAVASGLVDAKQLWRLTPYGILGSFVISALLTPPDLISQLLLAIPLSILYLLGVLAGTIFSRRRRPPSD